VTAYAVASRRTEIGIRMALGAQATSAIRLVLARTSLLVGVGMLIGMAISLWASRFIRVLIYGLEPRDPITLAASLLTLVVVAIAAAWFPARRAARTDPAAVLREG
jgi:ABC-type antimicrobial peptide transport system permease subunit